MGVTGCAFVRIVDLNLDSAAAVVVSKKHLVVKAVVVDKHILDLEGKSNITVCKAH